MPQFRGPIDYNAFRMTNNIKYSLKFWLDAAFLTAGAYENVDLGETDAFGNDESLMFLYTEDDRYNVGQAWQGINPNWVYESGFAPPATVTAPIMVSGVYVDSTFYPSSTSGAYAHHIDYINGRVLFDTAIASGSSVQVAHSYKRVYVGIATEEESKTLIQSALGNPEASGWPEYPTDREVYMPAIFVDSDTVGWIGAQLGGGKMATQGLFFHVFANDDYELANISEMVGSIQDSTIEVIDWNRAPFPLDQYGDRTTDYTPYDQAAALYHYKLIKLVNATVYRTQVEDSFVWKPVAMDAEVWMLEI